MKILPNLFKKKKQAQNLPNQPQGQVPDQQPNQQNQLPKQSNQNTSPNLLVNQFSPDSFYAKNQQKLTKVLKTFIFGMQALFLVVILFNYFLNKRLVSEQYETATLEASLKERQPILEEAKILNKRVTIYKNFISQKHSFGENVDTLLSAVPGSIEIKSIDFSVRKEGEPVKANVYLSTANALQVALFITNLLENESVPLVSINSASLDGPTGIYDVALEVNYAY